MNPEHFDIENMKLFGMWPHTNLISRSIVPYINRLAKEKVNVVVEGDFKGESVADMLDNCKKINQIFVHNKYTGDDADLLQAIFKKNTKPYSDRIVYETTEQADVVCINDTACTPEILEMGYASTPSRGIFCGNGHDTAKVKQALVDFRRSNKIGTPIQVCNASIWFWYKR